MAEMPFDVSGCAGGYGVSSAGSVQALRSAQDDRVLRDQGDERRAEAAQRWVVKEQRQETQNLKSQSSQRVREEREEASGAIGARDRITICVLIGGGKDDVAKDS